MNNMIRPYQMQGDLKTETRTLLNAGFMSADLGSQGFERGSSLPLFSRGGGQIVSDELANQLATIERGEFVGDINQLLLQLGMSMKQFERGVTSGMTAFPVRENLESEASILVPLDTPIRNKLPRHSGSGVASQWRQITSLGGGWGTTYDQPGGVSNIRMFFAETGAPAEHTTVYAAKSMGYKLLGTYGSVTGFAMAAGANFQNQLAVEKTNAIRNLMLNEECALLNGDSTSTAAPWGDGTNALAFDGMIPLIATANGTPTAHIQTSVGALTTGHIDAQLRRLYNVGAQGTYIIMNGQEVLSLVHLAEGTGTIIRVGASAMDGKTVIGVHVTGIVHPVTGEIVPVLVSRFCPAGTIIFGAERLPDGRPAADVEVLPQAQLPELAPHDNVQGYTAQELAPSLSAPQVYAFIVSVFQVLRMKSAIHFAKSTGVTAV